MFGLARKWPQSIRSLARVFGQSARMQASKAGSWMEGDVTMESELVHAAVEPDRKIGAIFTPLYLSITFVQESVEKYLEKRLQSLTHNKSYYNGA